MSRILAVLALTLATAHAEPPPGADSALGPFYRSLRVPGDGPAGGASCCDVSDCRPVLTRIRDGKIKAFIGAQFRDPPNAWVEIPENVMIHGVPNQQGQPVVCWFLGAVRCFLDGGSS